MAKLSSNSAGLKCPEAHLVEIQNWISKMTTVMGKMMENDHP